MDSHNQIDNLGNNFFLLFNPEKRGLPMSHEYQGLELVFQKRWRDNWQLLGSWTIQKAKGSAGLVGVIGGPFLDQTGAVANYLGPNRLINADGELGWSRRHVFKVTANYLFPEPIGVNVAVFFRHTSGYPWARNFNVFGLNQGFTQINAEQRGARRTSAVNLLDVGAEKQFRLPRPWGTLHVYLDVFNVFNSNTVTLVWPNSGRRFGQAANFLAPRVLRLGGGWQF